MPLKLESFKAAKIGILLKLKSPLNGNLTKILISLKQESHTNCNLTKMLISHKF